MMSNAQAMPIVGVFENHREASGVFLGLLAAGFPRKNIAIAARSNWIGAATGAQAARASGARGNTATASARHGALAALGIVSGVVPAIGSVIAAGALRVVVTNPTGATDLVTALIDAGLPAMKARYYRREVEAGRLIMMIDAGARADDAIAVLRSQRPFAESSPFPTMWG